MTTPRDPDEILATWLDEGPTRIPDQTRRAIAVAIPTTTQRRRGWTAPWRFAIMTMTSKVAIGALTVVAILVGGAFLLRPGPADHDVGGAPSATLAATPSPTAAATPAASSTPGAIGVGENTAPLAAGTYTVFDPFPVHMTMTIPVGWSGNVGGPYAVFLQRSSGPGAIGLTIFNDVYVDPCHSEKGLLSPRPGSSVDALSAVLAKMPDVDPTKPVKSTIGGQAATQLTLTAPASATCSPDPAEDLYLTWKLPLGAVQGIGPRQQDRVWITEVDGTRVVIDAQEPIAQDAALHAEIQSILDSIQIHPTGS
jgi:hypothetical protein